MILYREYFLKQELLGYVPSLYIIHLKQRMVTGRWVYFATHFTVHFFVTYIDVDYQLRCTHGLPMYCPRPLHDGYVHKKAYILSGTAYISKNTENKVPLPLHSRLSWSHGGCSFIILRWAISGEWNNLNIVASLHS